MKDGSPRLRKTYSAKEPKSKRRSAPGSSVDSKAQSSSSSSPKDLNVPASEEMSPEDVNVTRRGNVCTGRDNKEVSASCPAHSQLALIITCATVVGLVLYSRERLYLTGFWLSHQL